MTDDEPSCEGDDRPRSMGSLCAVDLDVGVDAPAWHDADPAIESLIRQAALAALDAAGTTGKLELSILLTDDARQAALNHGHRGKPGSTNVLSFPSRFEAAVKAPTGPQPLGDISLALETVCREAADQAKPLSDHVRHLVIHGVLHLLGHDHEDEAEARLMEALEIAILAGLGVPDPYDGDERAA